MMRLAGGCDVELTITVAEPAPIAATLGGAAPITASMDGTRYTARFAASAVTDGVNTFTVAVPAVDRDDVLARRVTPTVLITAVPRRLCAAPP